MTTSKIEYPPLENDTNSASRWSIFNWKRTSLELLAACEEKILSCLPRQPLGRYVSLSNGSRRIWTITLNAAQPQPRPVTPLVLLHGMGAGVALWVLNLEALSRARPVYAIDVLGFGRSSRPRFSTIAQEVEREFVDSIEDWRREVGLDKMILMGHSLGGYLATAYALQHPDHVKHLILTDPWGFPVRPPSQEVQSKLPVWAKIVRRVIEPFNPFAVLRAAGPWGPSLVTKFRADLSRKYEKLFQDSRICDYLYHCNAQHPSGETAFVNMTYQFGWAKNPMVERVRQLPNDVSMTFIYGSRSWVDYAMGYEVKHRRSDAYVDVQVLRDAGHHVYADQPDMFNSLVNRACDMLDMHKSALKSRSPRTVSTITDGKFPVKLLSHSGLGSYNEPSVTQTSLQSTDNQLDMKTQNSTASSDANKEISKTKI